MTCVRDGLGRCGGTLGPSCRDNVLRKISNSHPALSPLLLGHGLQLIETLWTCPLSSLIIPSSPATTNELQPWDGPASNAIVLPCGDGQGLRVLYQGGEERGKGGGEGADRARLRRGSSRRRATHERWLVGWGCTWQEREERGREDGEQWQSVRGYRQSWVRIAPVSPSVGGDLEVVLYLMGPAASFLFMSLEEVKIQLVALALPLPVCFSPNRSQIPMTRRPRQFMGMKGSRISPSIGPKRAGGKTLLLD